MNWTDTLKAVIARFINVHDIMVIGTIGHAMMDGDTRKMSQLDKFNAPANELEMDEDKECFNAKLKAVAKPRPKDDRKKI